MVLQNRFVNFGLTSKRTKENCQVCTKFILQFAQDVFCTPTQYLPSTKAHAIPYIVSADLTRYVKSYTVSLLIHFDSSVSKSEVLHGNSFHVQVRKVKSSTVTLHMRYTRIRGRCAQHLNPSSTRFLPRPPPTSHVPHTKHCSSHKAKFDHRNGNSIKSMGLQR